MLNATFCIKAKGEKKSKQLQHGVLKKFDKASL